MKKYDALDNHQKTVIITIGELNYYNWPNGLHINTIIKLEKLTDRRTVNDRNPESPFSFNDLLSSQDRQGTHNEDKQHCIRWKASNKW